MSDSPPPADDDRDDSDEILSALERELNSLNAASELRSPATAGGRPYRSLPRNYVPPGGADDDDAPPPPEYGASAAVREPRRFTFDHAARAPPLYRRDLLTDEDEYRTYPYQRRRYEGAPAYAATPSSPTHGARPCSTCRYHDDGSASAYSLVPHSPAAVYPSFYPWRPLYKSHSLPSAAELQEKLKRLEGDKASLQLQVQVLSEQVEAQTEKIVDLERNLGSKRDKLGSTEQLLQTEMVTRSSLETHKLDLMTEISNMKLKVAALEKEKIEMHEALHTAQIDYKLMQSKLTDRESEIAGIKFKQGAPSHATSLFGRSHESPAEVEKLRQALENMVVANEEKDRVIDDLKKTVNRFKRVQEIVAGPSPRKPHGDPGADDDLSEFSGINIMAKPTQERCHTMPSPSATSTPLGSWLESPTIVTGKPPISGLPAVAAATGKPPHGNMAAMREDYSAANSCEDVNPYQEKTPPTQRRNTSESAQQREFPRDAEHQNPHIEAYGTMGPDHQRKHSKQKGIMKLFGRLRRSSSQNLEDKHQQQGAPPGSPEAAATNGTFQRGGFRATAGPRLAWSRDLKPGELDTPFARWDGDKVAMWVHEIGLSSYVIESKRWVKNGDQLLRATPQDLEKELGIHNPLHRKKLQLALQAVGSEEMDAKCNLDHHWVTRWLDDVGLPQYKESFSDARVDGRMLHYLTVEDLLQMKVTNILHHVSLKRGIQLLRLHNYNPNCLRRRPTDMEGVDNDPRDVMLWTNHRVMEWLRTADLSEYAPNLRGSGVHGALIILENRFNAELLAQILNIPASKTLLRRHLSTHYTSLVGQDCLKRKRDVEVAATFVALSPSQKLKPKTRGLFRKKSKENIDYDEYVCPMDIQGPSGHCVTRAGALPRQNSDPLLAKKEAQVAHEVGAFSREIDTLTTMIQKDVDMLNESVPTSDV